MEKLIPQKTGLVCSKCEKISIRIFDNFLLPSNFNPPNFIILNWLGCQNTKCRNWFQRLKNLSRCPVCELWSVRFSLLDSLLINFENKIWQCENQDCGWNFKIVCEDD